MKIKAIKQQIASLVILLLAAIQAEAADNLEKCHAKHFHFKQQAVMLKAGASQARIFIFHNHAGQTIYLDHPVQSAGASAGWGSQLSADHWSALLVQDRPKAMAWTCAQMHNGNYQKISCKAVLKVCAVKVKPKSDGGTFWLSENQTSKPMLWQKIKLRKVLEHS